MLATPLKHPPAAAPYAEKPLMSQSLYLAQLFKSRLETGPGLETPEARQPLKTRFSASGFDSAARSILEGFGFPGKNSNT